MKKRIIKGLLSLVCVLGFLNVAVGCGSSSKTCDHCAPGASAMQMAANNYQEYVLNLTDKCQKDITSVKYTGGDSLENPARITFSNEGQTFDGYYEIINGYTVFIKVGGPIVATREADVPFYGLITLSKDYKIDKKKLSQGEKYIQMPKIDYTEENTCPII